MFSTRLWRNGAFIRFFIGATLSVVGDWFNTVAIAVLTYRITGQVSLVAATIAVSVLPRVLLAPIGGALADRFERRRLLVILDFARAVVALLPLLAHDAATLWSVYAAIILLQIGACIYNPAQGAYISNLVPDDMLEAANAAYATMRDIGLFAGPALAATALGLQGPGIAFWSNALSFAVAGALLLTLPRGVQTVQPSSVRALLASYVDFPRRYPRLACLYPCYLAYVIPIYFFQAIMVAYALHLGQPTTFIGTLYAAAGLGGAIGGIAMGQCLRRLPYGVAILIFAMNVPILGILALLHQAGPALILLALSVAAGTAGDVIFAVIVQRHVATEERGRAFGLVFWCIAIGQLIGAGLGIALTPMAITALLWVSLSAFAVMMVSVACSIRVPYTSIHALPKTTVAA